MLMENDGEGSDSLFFSGAQYPFCRAFLDFTSLVNADVKGNHISYVRAFVIGFPLLTCTV